MLRRIQIHRLLRKVNLNRKILLKPKRLSRSASAHKLLPKSRRLSKSWTRRRQTNSWTSLKTGKKRRATSKLLPVFQTSGMKRSKSRINWPNVLSYSSNASTRAVTVSSRRAATSGITSGSTLAKGHLNVPDARKHSPRVEIWGAIWRMSTMCQEENFPRRSSALRLPFAPNQEFRRKRDQTSLRTPCQPPILPKEVHRKHLTSRMLPRHLATPLPKSRSVRTTSSLSTSRHNLRYLRIFPMRSSALKPERSFKNSVRSSRTWNWLSVLLEPIRKPSRVSRTSLNLLQDKSLTRFSQAFTNRLFLLIGNEIHVYSDLRHQDWSAILHTSI